MEGDQTILEPPQADDTHTSSKATGKRPQVFSFGKLLLFPCDQELIVKTSRIGRPGRETRQAMLHSKLYIATWA